MNPARFAHAHKIRGLEGIKELLRATGFESVEKLPSKRRHLFYLLASSQSGAAQ